MLVGGGACKRVGVVCNLVAMVSNDLGGVTLIGLSTLFSNISGVFRAIGLPLTVTLFRLGVELE